ncbi:IS30 family transposase [Bifidobacterium sp. M3-N-101]|uniref:IS30 family transposase n=1 Tax=Bifidobacterium sp. M3-N-101 TaxID=2949653 RepID=UPI00202EC1DF|nr:IS30 family transposase [Bifidobacterium sp. M3-N-101]MCM0690996.1 IS30 family transposase [Bifidobacterium sp. M3-N-101]
MGQQYSHLSSEERILIEKLHCEQHPGIRRTAERIGRDKSTVSRELRRGLWFASNENGSYRPYRPKRLKTGPWTSGPFYSALAAQRKADLRRRGSRKPRRMDSGPLRAWVLDALRRGWSPELIEGRLKARYAGDPSMRISHECLYQWIYAKPQRALDLRHYLARGRKRRTRKKGRKAKGPRIPMRVPIADRPEAVGSRKGFGHFESDTVVGAAPSRRCMNTQVERRSRGLFARLVDDKSASATARAEYEIFKDMPPAARVDRTWDNGTEASLHMLVDEALGMLTYFADPYSSWQRGSNENRNGRIRRYLPKGTSFEDLTQDELDAIVGEINDTPMKLLGYKTPNEVWDEEMAKLQSKQADPKPAVALTS